MMYARIQWLAAVLILLSVPGRQAPADSEGINMEDGTSIVFVGDSITHGGDWSRVLGRTDIVNKGIPGDTTRDVLARLDDVAAAPARRYFVMIGVNDLSRHIPIEEIVANVGTILTRLGHDHPDADFILQSILPVNDTIGYFLFSNGDIDRVNEGLQELAEANSKVEYLDLHPVLGDENGQLAAGYTMDGLHLGEAGYIDWAEALRDYVE